MHHDGLIMIEKVSTPLFSFIGKNMIVTVQCIFNHAFTPLPNIFVLTSS